MKIKVQYAGGLNVDKIVTRLPFVGEPLDGEIVDRVTEVDPARAGYAAYVLLRKLPDDESS